MGIFIAGVILGAISALVANRFVQNSKVSLPTKRVKAASEAEAAVEATVDLLNAWSRTRPKIKAAVTHLQSELTAARDEIENLKSGQIKTDNSQTLVNALEEIEALKLANRDLQHWFDDARDENKTLREGMERVNANAEKHEREMYLAQDEAERLRGRVGELEATVQLAVENAKEDDPDVWIQIDRVLAADNSRAWLLRKQAEAAEDCADYFGGRDFVDVRFIIDEHAKHLRTKADELEAGGGE